MRDRIGDKIFAIVLACLLLLYIILKCDIDGVKTKQAMLQDQIGTIATNQLDMAESQQRMAATMRDIRNIEAFTLTNLIWVVHMLK